MAEIGNLKIISGTLGGRIIHFPSVSGIRPTSGKLREAVFSSLSSRLDYADLRVLDLFSGSGALGIEAISRGAKSATFVERDRGLAEALKINLGKLGISGQTNVRCQDVAKWVKDAANGPAFNLVLADPPYHQGLLDGLAASLASNSLLDRGAYLFMECDKKEKPDVPEDQGFELIFEKFFGDSKAYLYFRE